MASWTEERVQMKGTFNCNFDSVFRYLPSSTYVHFIPSLASVTAAPFNILA